MDEKKKQQEQEIEQRRQEKNLKQISLPKNEDVQTIKI